MKLEIKKGVLTSYKVGKNLFSSYVVGNNDSEIYEKIVSRGLDEKIESSLIEVETIPDYSTLSDLEFIMDLPQIIHTTCFMSLIALKANKISIDEVLGDEGILHELIHINSKSIPISKPKIREIKRGFNMLRNVTTGVC